MSLKGRDGMGSEEWDKMGNGQGGKGGIGGMGWERNMIDLNLQEEMNNFCMENLILILINLVLKDVILTGAYIYKKCPEETLNFFFQGG